MKISKIEIENFKSFENICANLNNFNVVVGECASGKSNFIEAIRFLKDISENAENGINKHGNYFMQNFKHNTDNPTCLNHPTLNEGGDS